MNHSISASRLALRVVLAAATGIALLACATGEEDASAPSPSRDPSPAPSPSPTPTAPEGIREADVVADAFEVLDINWNTTRVAFRMTYHLAGEENCDQKDSVSCDYPGMNATEASGVVYGLWDIASDQLEGFWEVYPAATSKEGCLPAAESDKRLAEANAAFAAAALDPDARPAPTTLDALGLTSRYDSTPIEGSASSYTGALEVVKGAVTLHQRQREFDGAMASRGTFEVPQAWSNKMWVILLEKWSYQCNFECCSDAMSYSFSPILELDATAGDPRGAGQVKTKTKGKRTR